MKIIAKAANNTYLAEVSDYELLRIMGFRYESETKKKLEIGAEIPVSRLYDALTIERERPEELNKLARSLRAIADKVESVNNLLSSPIVEPKE